MATVLCFVFIPLILIFFAFTKTELNIEDIRATHESRGKVDKRQFFRNDVFSKLTFTISAFTVSGIVLLAWAAGENRFSISNDLGIWITALVMLCFIAMIASPHIVKALNRLSEERGDSESVVTAAAVWAASPIASASYIDSALVRLIAPLSGATLTGAFWKPYAALIGTILPLSALGYGLPAPYGLIPLGFAVTIVIALGRRWAWVEEDRELASRIRTTRGPSFHVGFRNDLKDEALLGYACFFFLVPLILNQLQEWSPAFEVVAAYSAGNGFIDWLRFFGAELAKAVPFVDWWEIYDVDVKVPFEPSETNPLAKHLTFGARAVVDLVIMAALIQAFSLWQRGQTQKRLYGEGQVDAFDPFTELDFFDRGISHRDGVGPVSKPDVGSLTSLLGFTIQAPDGRTFGAKPKFIATVLKHVEQRRQLGFDPVPYNRRRLGELRNERVDDLRYGALWLMEAFDVLAGTSSEQLSGFVKRLEKVEISKADDQILRTLRREAERIISEMTVTRAILTPDSFTDILTMLGTFAGRSDFDTLRDSIIVLLEESQTRRAANVLAALVLPNFAADTAHLLARIKTEFRLDRFDDFQHALERAHFTTSPVREAAYHALARMAMKAEESPDKTAISDWTGQVLELASQDDGDRSEKGGRAVARRLYEEIKKRAEDALEEKEYQDADEEYCAPDHRRRLRYPSPPTSRFNGPRVPPYIAAMPKPMTGVSGAAAKFEFEAFQSAVARPDHWAPQRLATRMETRIN